MSKVAVRSSLVVIFKITAPTTADGAVNQCIGHTSKGYDFLQLQRLASYGNIGKIKATIKHSNVNYLDSLKKF